MRTQEVTTKFHHPLEVYMRDCLYSGYISIEYNVFMELTTDGIEVFAVPFNIETLELIRPTWDVDFGVKITFDDYINNYHRDIICKLANQSDCLSHDKTKDELVLIPKIIEINADTDKYHTYDQ